MPDTWEAAAAACQLPLPPMLGLRPATVCPLPHSRPCDEGVTTCCAVAAATCAKPARCRSYCVACSPPPQTPAFWGGDISLRVTAVVKAGSQTIDVPVDIANIQASSADESLHLASQAWLGGASAGSKDHAGHIGLGARTSSAAATGPVVAAKPDAPASCDGLVGGLERHGLRPGLHSVSPWRPPRHARPPPPSRLPPNHTTAAWR